MLWETESRRSTRARSQGKESFVSANEVHKSVPYSRRNPSGTSSSSVAWLGDHIFHK